MYRPSHPPFAHPTTPPRTFAYALLSEKINAATPICLLARSLACSLACFLVNLISTSAPSYHPHYHLLSTRGLLAQASYACVLDPCSSPASVSQPRLHMLPPSISSPPGPYIKLARLEARHAQRVSVWLGLWCPLLLSGRKYYEPSLPNSCVHSEFRFRSSCDTVGRDDLTDLTKSLKSTMGSSS